MNFKTSSKQHLAITFVLCAFILTALTTLVPLGDLEYAVKFQLLATLIVPIPTIVALVLTSVTGGVRSFLQETFTGRVSLRWVLIALGIGLGVRLLISILGLATGVITTIEVSTAVPVVIVMIYLFALLEEIGWRGFALRHLLLHHNPFVALLITGIPWSAIHILFYLALGKDAGMVLMVFGYMLGLSIIVTWVYLRSDQNIWVAVILHGSQTLFGIVNANIPADVINQYSLIAYSLIALVILVFDWRMWFARPVEKQAGQAVPTAV